MYEAWFICEIYKQLFIYKERITYSSVARVAADKNHVVSVIVFGKGQGSDCERRKKGAATASWMLHYKKPFLSFEIFAYLFVWQKQQLKDT